MKQLLAVLILILIPVGGFARRSAVLSDSSTNDGDTAFVKRIDINIDKFFRHDYIRLDTAYDKKAVTKSLRKIPDCKRWVFGIGGGPSFRIVQDPVTLPKDMLSYRRGLKLGKSFVTDATFFMSPNVGVGLRYEYFDLRNKSGFLYYISSDENICFGSRSDEIFIHFFGPMISLRSIPRNNKLYVSCDLVLGYSIYDNKIDFNGAGYELNEKNFGFASSVCADFLLSKDFSAGVALRISAASFKNSKLPQGDMIKLNENIAENFSRVSLALIFKTLR
jgi:hypothetical protein